MNTENVQNVKKWNNAKNMRPWYDCPECHHLTTNSSLMSCHLEVCLPARSPRPHRLRRCLTIVDEDGEFLTCSVCSVYQQYDPAIMQSHERECTGKVVALVESMADCSIAKNQVSQELADKLIAEGGSPRQLAELWSNMAEESKLREKRWIFREHDIMRRYGVQNSTLRVVHTGALNTGVTAAQCQRADCQKPQHPNVKWIRKIAGEPIPTIVVIKSPDLMWSHTGPLCREGKRRQNILGQILVQHLMPTGLVKLIALGKEWFTTGKFCLEIDDFNEQGGNGGELHYRFHAVVRSRLQTPTMTFGKFSFVKQPPRGDYLLSDGHRRTRARVE